MASFHRRYGCFSMADEQRRLLESLMGWDALISKVPKRDADLTSPRVCKAFVVGTCPHDVLGGSKGGIGNCPLLHLQKHKLEYEYRVLKGETFPNFITEYYQMLKKQLEESDREIAQAPKKMEQTADTSKVAEITREMSELDTEIGLIALEVKHLANAGYVQKALYENIRLDTIAQQRDQLAEQARSLAENVGQTAQQKLQVCEVCGLYLSRLDSDRRLADHFVGKTHLGYLWIRNECERLQQQLKAFNKSPSSTN